MTGGWTYNKGRVQMKIVILNQVDVTVLRRFQTDSWIVKAGSILATKAGWFGENSHQLNDHDMSYPG